MGLKALAPAAFLFTLALNLLSAPRSDVDDSELRATPQPEVALKTALGFHAVLGDLWWVQSLQYYASPRAASRCYPRLATYLRLAATLAPDYQSIYRFAAVAVPCPTVNGWLHVEEGVLLARDGFERFPANWFLGMLLAYDLQLLGRVEEASTVLARAARQPGSPEYLAGLATRLMAESGQLEAAEAVAIQLLEEETDEVRRTTLIKRIEDLRFVRAVREVRQGVETFFLRYGRVPHTLEELIEVGILSELPPAALVGGWKYDVFYGTVGTGNPEPNVRLHGVKK